MPPTVGDTEKEKARKSMYKRSQKGKKRTRLSAKEKSTCRVFTSQIYTFMFDSTVVLLELTRTALRGALDACIILVLRIIYVGSFILHFGV